MGAAVRARDVVVQPRARRFALAPMARARAARAAGAALAASALVAAAGTQAARAVIQPAVTIDGPSSEIVGFGNVAMASDGSGGLVYLKRVDGVAHVFVARYSHKWLEPVEIDAEDPFPASDPRIGAAEHGELLVVWITPFESIDEKPVYRLVSALLPAGSTLFDAPIPVDRNVGQGDETSPDLAMSSNGAADVVYRVSRQTQGERESIPLLRPGDVAEEVRVARFAGERWVDLGEINHDPGLSMRAPSPANAPQIAIHGSGEGIVVWQEPELDGVAMVWARRLFGSSVDYAMPVSLTSFGGSPFASDADAPAVAFSHLGEAVVAYRQLGGPGSPLPGPRIFVNVLPSGEGKSGTQFLGAQLADSQAAGGEQAAVGRPSIDLDEAGTASLLYDDNGVPRVIEGGELGFAPAFDLGTPFVGSSLAPASELSPVSVVDPQGGGVFAWPSADSHGDPGVAVREDFPDGAVQTALVSGVAGGPIDEISAGRSGLGDALVAFEQGPVGAAAIAAARVTAPPGRFVFGVPQGWIKPSQARVEWTLSSSANGPLTYTVVLDGKRLATPAGAQSMSLASRKLLDGVHKVQMLVVDDDGEATLTAPERLLIGRPPRPRPSRARERDHGKAAR